MNLKDFAVRVRVVQQNREITMGFTALTAREAEAMARHKAKRDELGIIMIISVREER